MEDRVKIVLPLLAGEVRQETGGNFLQEGGTVSERRVGEGMGGMAEIKDPIQGRVSLRGGTEGVQIVLTLREGGEGTTATIQREEIEETGRGNRGITV